MHKKHKERKNKFYNLQNLIDCWLTGIVAMIIFFLLIIGVWLTFLLITSKSFVALLILLLIILPILLGKIILEI